MKAGYQILTILIFLLGGNFLKGQSNAFIENRGQWEENFHFKLPAAYGGVFLEGERLTFNLSKPVNSRVKTKDAHHHHHPVPADSVINFHAYHMTFLNANGEAKGIGKRKKKEYFNYFLGNDTSRWKGNIGLFEEVVYEDLYPGINARYYFSDEGNLKYDLIVKSGSSPHKIQIAYTGQDGLKLVYGNLIVHTSVEDVLESVPYAYQIIDGKEKEVECHYHLEENVVSFEVGAYDDRYELVIDPVLVFSTYTGSVADNWGYTATYGEDGSTYGGGIVFGPGSGYPITPGAYQASYRSGLIDIVISKFSPDGTSLVYSTFLGGSQNEMPYSLIEGRDKELVILGNTSSNNFPVRSNAYQSLYKGSEPFDTTAYIDYKPGADIFVAKLDSTGGSLLASTFMGGTGIDAVNLDLEYNYGDKFRGDIAVDSAGNIYAVSNTFSGDFPTSGNVPFPTRPGGQDGVVFSMNSSLSDLNWSTYFGGSDDDVLFSLKLVRNNKLYITGGTESSGLSFPGISSYQDALAGDTDGFIAALNTVDGSIQAFTYNGTPERDLNFFVDYDRDLNICVFGQTLGAYPVQGENVYVNPNSAQFLQKLDPDLTRSIKSTVFGTGVRDKANISPVALMVDTCGNVYISGWGGEVNSSHGQGNLEGMPVTGNAYKPVTDGNDFYLMVMDASWERLSYATFFGQSGGRGDHVDGGTSRFRKDGTIFQAVCAGCSGSSGFPTTPGAFSRVNGSNNCNLAVFRFDLEIDITTVTVQSSKDSGCIPYQSNLLTSAHNADILLIEYPDGRRDTLVDELTIDHVGRRDYTFLAIDTSCGFRDSVTLSFFGYSDSLKADFYTDYDSCTSGLEVEFSNLSRDADTYFWDFGDSTTTNDMNPIHTYEEGGIYTITMVAQNFRCGRVDTVIRELVVSDRYGDGTFRTFYKPCEDTKAQFVTGGSGFDSRIWYVNDKETGRGTDFSFAPEQSGIYTIRLESIDSGCARYFSKERTLRMFIDSFDIKMPNIFTPNGDGENDFFGAIGNLDADFLESYSLKIYNRWGKELFASFDTNIEWDGVYKGDEVPEGVYYYLIYYEDICGNGEELKGFVHLFR